MWPMAVTDHVVWRPGGPVCVCALFTGIRPTGTVGNTGNTAKAFPDGMRCQVAHCFICKAHDTPYIIGGVAAVCRSNVTSWRIRCEGCLLRVRVAEPSKHVDVLHLYGTSKEAEAAKSTLH